MVNPRELRIGNLVFELDIDYDAGGNKIIDSSTPTIRVVDLYYFNEVLQDLANEGLYQPIPLTEEWLVKFGFEKTNRIYCDTYYLNTGYIEFQWDKETGLDFNSEGQNIATQNECAHVHQLQNLYFALTGEELTIL